MKRHDEQVYIQTEAFIFTGNAMNGGDGEKDTSKKPTAEFYRKARIYRHLTTILLKDKAAMVRTKNLSYFHTKNPRKKRHGLVSL